MKHKFCSFLATKINLKSSNKPVALPALTINYTQKNIRQQRKNNKLKIAPMLNHEFEFPDGFYLVSDIQDSIEYITKNKTSTNNPPIYIYNNRIKKRLD